MKFFLEGNLYTSRHKYLCARHCEESSTKQSIRCVRSCENNKEVFKTLCVIAFFFFFLVSLANLATAADPVQRLIIDKKPGLEVIEKVMPGADKILVRYEVKNKGKFDQTTRVSFFYPKINLAEVKKKGMAVILDCPTDNYLQFTVTLDEREFPYERKVSAWLVDGTEVTAELEKLELPFGSYSMALARALQKLDARTIDVLVARGIVFIDGKNDDGSRHVEPLWVAQVEYFWMQSFSVSAPTYLDVSFVPIPK